MVVYADILILLNMLVDYFLLLLTSKILQISVPLSRQIAAAVMGGLSSLLIFLPPLPPYVLLLIYTAAALIMTALCFSVKPFKKYLRNTAVLFAVTSAYSGLMIALWTLFHPRGMVIHNSAVYFNISPMYLIIFSVAAYFCVILARKFLSRNAPLAENLKIEIFADSGKINIDAIADSGNSMEDIFGISDIIIADRKAVAKLFGDLKDTEKLKHRYRAVPCTTVSGSELLDGYRCDKAYIFDGNEKFEIRNPVLAISKASMGDDYQAIINPKILN